MAGGCAKDAQANGARQRLARFCASVRRVRQGRRLMSRGERFPSLVVLRSDERPRGLVHGDVRFASPK